MPPVACSHAQRLCAPDGAHNWSVKRRAVPPVYRRGRATCASASSADLPSTQCSGAEQESSNQKPPVWKRISTWLFGGPLDKERLKGLGLGAFISYGFVSNVSYFACTVIGWSYHVAATGLTPMAEGQWPGFMGRMAGLLALQQVLRPLRFSCAVALIPLVNRMMDGVQERLQVSKRTAFGLMMGCLAVLSIVSLVGSLAIATAVFMPSSPA